MSDYNRSLIEKLEAEAWKSTNADMTLGFMRAISIVRENRTPDRDHVPGVRNMVSQQAEQPQEVVERVARALSETVERYNKQEVKFTWETLPPDIRNWCYKQAKAAIAEMERIRSEIPVMGGAGSDSSSPGLQGEIPENGPNEPTPPANDQPEGRLSQPILEGAVVHRCSRHGYSAGPCPECTAKEQPTCLSPTEDKSACLSEMAGNEKQTGQPHVVIKPGKMDTSAERGQGLDTPNDQPDEKPLHVITSTGCSICGTDALHCSFWKTYREPERESGPLPDMSVNRWLPIGTRPQNAGEQFLTTDGEMIIPSEAVGLEGMFHHNITCHVSIKGYEPTHWRPFPDLPDDRRRGPNDL